MRYVSNLLTFGGLWTVVVVSPGPDLMVTMRIALTRSRRAALATVAGIILGTAIWAAGAAMGLAVVTAQSQWIKTFIKWGGAAYLLLLASRVLRDITKPLAVDCQRDLARPPAASGGGLVTAWRTGLVADLSNPKAAVFWCSLFATTIPEGTPGWVSGVAVLLAVAIAGCWYASAALLFSIAPVLQGYQRAKRWIDLLTAGILTGLALRLVASD